MIPFFRKKTTNLNSQESGLCLDLLLGPVAGQPSSSASGGPVQIVDRNSRDDPVLQLDPPEFSENFSAETSPALQVGENKRYRLWKKTKDPLSEEGNLSNLIPVSVPLNNGRDYSSGKRTITISDRLGSFSRRLHPSHIFGHTRGILWCWRCGAYAITAPQTLSEPCPRGCDTYGRRCLNRIRRGLTPRSDLVWPDRGAVAEAAPPDLVIIAPVNAPLPENWVAKKRKRTSAGNLLPASEGAGPLKRGRPHRCD